LISVAVIGLGRVGCGEPPKAGGPVRSHVGAVLNTPGLSLVAAADPSPQAREAARKIWNLPASVLLESSIDKLPATEVIVVAGPTAARREMVFAAIDRLPKVLIVEKPFAANFSDAAEIAERARKKNVAIRVNFNRRFDPGHRAFRDAMTGDPKLVVLRYGKGLFNYASHMVDLLIGWFGTIVSVQALGPEPQADDPSLTFRARMTRGFDAVFIGIDGLNYDQFEAEFYFVDGKLELAAGGVEKRRYRAIADRYYPGYPQLGSGEEIMPAQLVGGFSELYRSVADHLTRGAPLAGCTAEDALHGMAVLDAALASAHSGGKSISIGANPAAKAAAGR
jgi:predicted dehydrogenase